MSKRIIYFSIALSIALAGCGFIPTYTSNNFPLNQKIPDTKTDASACDPQSRSSISFSTDCGYLPPAFIGISLSGGGSRAANFGMAALSNLYEMGILQHATAISSTSGGGLPAAYYALNIEKMDWTKGRALMLHNYLGSWITKVASPYSFLTMSTHLDRSDLMADVFDETLFFSKTFGHLGDFKKGMPILLLNSSNINTGNRFTFTKESFREDLKSDINSFPISNAVMASAAFPGAFNSVTLRQYFDEKPKYTHLLDGGPTDNLGIESLLVAASAYQKAVTTKNNSNSQPNPCLLIAIDAYPEPQKNQAADAADTRKFYDHIVDTNFIDAFDMLLSRRRMDMLQRLGLGPGAKNSGRELPIGAFDSQLIELGISQSAPNIQISSFDYPIDQTGYVWNGLLGSTVSNLEKNKESAPTPKGYFRCDIWHLNLSAASAVRPYIGEQGTVPTAISSSQYFWTPLGNTRRGLDRAVSKISTNFKLTGPKNCTRSQLQELLYTSAFIVTRQDYASSQRICKWFEDNQLQVSQQCRSFPGSDIQVSEKTLFECIVASD